MNLIEQGASVTVTNSTGTYYGEIVSNRQIIGKYLVRLHTDAETARLCAVSWDRVVQYVNPLRAVNELAEV